MLPARAARLGAVLWLRFGCALAILLAGCDDRAEGVVPGDCSDAQDNDGDGLFDCSDFGCHLSDACTVSTPQPPNPVEPTILPARDFRCEEDTPGCVTDVPVRSDEERTIEDTTGDGQRFVYVIQELVVPLDPASSAGFNLDGLDSGEGSSMPDATCEQLQADVTSLLDPEHPGIDNAVAGLVPSIEPLIPTELCDGSGDSCFDRQLAERIADGTNLVILELLDVQSLENDASVEVRVYAAEGPPMLGGDGLVARDQSFTIVRELAIVNADIFGGRLRTDTFDGLFLLLFGDPDAPLVQLNGAQLRANVQPDELGRGSLGASATVDAVTAAVSSIMPGIENTVRSVIESTADIAPTSARPEVCSSISMGFRFTAVRAEMR